MFTGPIYFGNFFLLLAHLMANIHIDVRRSHLLWQFLFVVGTPYGKYAHQCSQVPSTLAISFCFGHTLLQIFTPMLTGPIYFGNFFLLWAHLMANIHIDVHRSHLLRQFLFVVGTPYGKYAHQCSQVPSTLAISFCFGRTLWQIFTSMFTGPIYFGNFFLLCAHLMANTHINVHRSHLLWLFFFARCTPNGKYSHRCSKLLSTLAYFSCYGDTLWQISTSMFTGPIYFGLFFCCGHTLWQIRASMFTGPIYFRNFSLLCAHLMSNIHINVYRSHLLWQFFFAVCTPYGKYLHQCLQAPSTLAVFLCCVHTSWQIFASMLTSPIYFGTFL